MAASTHALLDCSASSARRSRPLTVAPAPMAEIASPTDRNEHAEPQFDPDLKGASFETLKATCAKLNIFLQPSIDEQVASIIRQKAQKHRLRQFQHALRMRILRAIHSARAAAIVDTVCQVHPHRPASISLCCSHVQEEEEPEDENTAAVRFELTTCEDLYHVGDGTLRSQAHAVAILLRARGFIPRELDVDGTAMRAIAAVIANGLASTVVADRGPQGKDMLVALGIDNYTNLAGRFRTTHQQIKKYEGLLIEAGYTCSGNASTCWHFCSCFGWESVAGPGLCSGCPCPRCAVTHHEECGTTGGVLQRAAARVASAVLPRSVARARLGIGDTYGMPGAWASQDAHFQHLRHMSSQCQTVEDFATFVTHEPSSPPADETPEERHRRLMAKFRRVRAEFTEGTVAKVLPSLRK